MSYTTVVSTETLAAHLDDPSWIVIDCRHMLKDEGYGHAAYLAEHVPGAVFASVEHDLSGSPTGTNGRHPLPSPAALASTFGRLGIGPSMQVVAYDQDVGQYASRCWWMLRYVGHDSVAVLDGGWAAWLREERPTRTGEERRPPAVFTPHPRDDMHTTVGDVEARLHDAAALLVDARSPERFAGQPDPLDRVPGHIPGARNRFYRNNVSERGTIREASELRAEFTDVLGGRKPEDAVMYCGSGVTACHNLLAMEHAGLRGAKLYVGSWSEWESSPARPIERGR